MIAKPDNRYGYTQAFLERELSKFGPDCFDMFLRWMQGQTTAVDEGTIVFYAADVDLFVSQYFRTLEESR